MKKSPYHKAAAVAVFRATGLNVHKCVSVREMVVTG